MAFKMDIAIKYCLEAKINFFHPEKKKGIFLGPLSKKVLIPEIFWKRGNMIILASKKFFFR